jgi:hypothetical protein
VEAFPATVGGREVICLRDPSGLSEAVLTLSRQAAAVLALLDGSRSLLDVQADLMRAFGELVPRSELEALVSALDEHLFLESERLAAERERVRAAFASSRTRAPAHAGRAYPGDAESLWPVLDGFFGHPAGPGPAGPPDQHVIHGLIAPHIDFARGGPAYAWAYRAVAEAADIDCVILLGTAHAGLDGHAFAATRKQFVTPFGDLAVDGEVLEAIVRRAPSDLFAAELAHRAEHSIEFQAVYLAYLRARAERAGRSGLRGLRIVPLLASFVHECLAQRADPMTVPGVAGVLDALRSAMTTLGRRYCVIAGADLAHVGPRFGDPAPLSASELRRVETEDRALLERVAERDADGFLGMVGRDGDRRRICGLSPIYALLQILAAGSGEVLRYGQWPDPQGTVTFASVAFREPGRD